MRATRILDCLFSEEEGFCCGGEWRAGGGRGERGGGVFEEEDYAVDGGEGGEGCGVEGEEFFELDAGDAEVVEEEGEDAGVGFDYWREQRLVSLFPVVRGEVERVRAW